VGTEIKEEAWGGGTGGGRKNFTGRWREASNEKERGKRTAERGKVCINHS